MTAAELTQVLQKIPPDLLHRMKLFFLDGNTGNIQVNIKDGRILGFRVEEVVSLKTDGR